MLAISLVAACIGDGALLIRCCRWRSTSVLSAIVIMMVGVVSYILEIKPAAAPPARSVQGIEFRSTVYLLFKLRNPKNTENPIFFGQSQAPAKNTVASYSLKL